MDDDEITKRRRIPKIVGYTKQVVPSLQDREFQRHFRLYRPTFEFILREVGTKISNEFTAQIGRCSVTADKQLLVAVWTLANQECYRLYIL